ncbi:MAG: lysylphosphatidylglycerol synthase transmembrane domain-containing protein [Alphaproteobacteria bacterium]
MTLGRQLKQKFMRWIVPVLGGLLALGIVFWLYRDLDIVEFAAILQNAKPWWVAALGATILLEQVIQGWKWRQLLFDIKMVSVWRLTGAFLAGYAANTLVPLGISPVVRSWLVARTENLKVATVLVTTVISRFVDGIVFAAMAGLAAATVPVMQLETGVGTGLLIAGLLNVALFGGALWLLFRARHHLNRETSFASRIVERISRLSQRHLSGIRLALVEGIIWPRQRRRQIFVIGASVTMKLVALTHFLWAGLAIGVRLDPLDYLFLMVFAGFGMIIARFVRMPGGFIIGSGLAMKLVGVPDEQAIVMILLNQMTSVILVIGIGFVILGRSGIEIRGLQNSP